MSSSSSLLLHLSPPPPSLLLKPQASPHLPSLSLHLPKPKPLTITLCSPSPSPSFEESRWLREEQRWLREEQRWLREESRWHSERQSLLREIDGLKAQLQALGETKRLPGPPESNLLVEVSSVNQKQISESGSSAVPIMLEGGKEEVVEEVKEVVVEEVKKVEKRKMKTMRIGAEGDEVQAMQDALLNLGFYSGEEEMEYAIFSTGTERAIKTWQASIGVPEDGVMTVELLEKLFPEQGTDNENSTSTLEKENSNGASVTNLTEVSETKPVVTDDAEPEADPSYHKVFLLGENRWEDSSRLTKRDKITGERLVGISTTKCVACRGEGHILCTECDGTGEPNVESQFLEWVDEGAKCPYCDGLGFNICDVCEGKTIIHP